MKRGDRIRSPLSDYRLTSIPHSASVTLDAIIASQDCRTFHIYDWTGRLSPSRWRQQAYTVVAYRSVRTYRRVRLALRRSRGRRTYRRFRAACRIPRCALRWVRRVFRTYRRFHRAASLLSGALRLMRRTVSNLHRTTRKRVDLRTDGVGRRTLRERFGTLCRCFRADRLLRIDNACRRHLGALCIRGRTLCKGDRTRCT